METPGDRPPLQPGTLYLVATPIGNLEDITLRAIRTLKECDAVAAEDTRRTGLLLQHLGIRKPMLSYHRFNEARRSEDILGRLRSGQTVALVTDAGTPGISDPGERVVRAALDAGLRVESVPGPCALVAALTASGQGTDRFRFAGFLPVKAGQRARMLEALVRADETVVLYESPFRVEKLLGELAARVPERQVVVARELTKRFEEYLRGTPGEILARTRGRSWKGEVTVILAGAASDPHAGGELGSGSGDALPDDPEGATSGGG